MDQETPDRDGGQLSVEEISRVFGVDEETARHLLAIERGEEAGCVQAVTE
jgi:hypothetical protein